MVIIYMVYRVRSGWGSGLVGEGRGLPSGGLGLTDSVWIVR